MGMYSKLAGNASIRAGNHSDTALIVDLVAGEASHGHFSQTHSTEGGKQILANALKNVIDRHHISRATYRGIETVPAELWVLWKDDLTPLGFLVVAGIDNKGGFERELYMVGVHPDYREHGFGSQLVDFFCTHYAEHALYAQCYPASRQMSNMLVKRGFIQYGKTNGGNQLLSRQTDPSQSVPITRSTSLTSSGTKSSHILKWY